MARLAGRIGLLARHEIVWREGFRNAAYSLPLAGRTFVDSFRQQGFRILLGLYGGAASVTTLTTTRTFANVLHQGLTTITTPLMPELMRYVVNRDQDRMEGAFSIVWLCLFVLLVPGVLLLCLLAEPLFLFWTRGEVTYDPVLFLTLLTAVLVFAAAQPAAAILQGQNRIAWMIGSTLAGAFALGAAAILLMPPLGLRGAGLALLVAEVGALAVTILGAIRTLQPAHLVFPRRSFALVALNVAGVFGLSLLAILAMPQQPSAFLLPLALNVAMALLYWATIPDLARARIAAVLVTAWSRLSGRTKTVVHADGSDRNL